MTVYTVGCILLPVKPIYLRVARKKAGFTQKALEAKSGVPQAVISRLEKNPDARPAFDTVIKLADAIGIDPRALRFGQRDAVTA